MEWGTMVFVFLAAVILLMTMGVMSLQIKIHKEIRMRIQQGKAHTRFAAVCRNCRHRLSFPVPDAKQKIRFEYQCELHRVFISLQDSCHHFLSDIDD